MTTLLLLGPLLAACSSDPVAVRVQRDLPPPVPPPAPPTDPFEGDTGTPIGTGTGTGTTPIDLDLEAVLDMAQSPTSRRESCGDLFASVQSPDGSLVLWVNIDETIALEAHLVNHPMERDWPLSVGHIEVKAQWGPHAAAWLSCDDAPYYEPIVQGWAEAIDGTLRAEVRPDPGGTEFEPLGTADLLLEDVVMRSDDGTVQTLPRLELQNLPVGWLPG